jgi:hypothetical protein
MSSTQAPDESPREWLVMLSGERRGPYTQRALYDVLDTHPDSWKAPVWRPGMRGWLPAREVSVLLREAETATHAARRGMGAAIFLDTPSEPVLATQPIAYRGRGRQSAPTPREVPTYRPPRARAPLRYAALGAAVGGAVALAALALLWLNLRPPTRTRPRPTASAAAQRPAPRAMEHPLASRELPPPEPEGERPRPPSAFESVAQPALAAPRPATSAPPQPGSRVKRVRVRARWAPIRAEGDPRAQVLCSLPRGALLAVSDERPGTHARWLAVRCDAHTPGWIHENFLAHVAELDE